MNPFVDTGLINCQQYSNDPKDLMKAQLCNFQFGHQKS